MSVRERVCFCESNRDAVVLKELIMTQDTVKITRPRCAQNYHHNCQERDRCKLLGEMVSRIILEIIWNARLDSSRRKWNVKDGLSCTFFWRAMLNIRHSFEWT